MPNIHYIAFLRSINVGGHSVKMEYLRSIFSELGFSNVRTYIQSGNVFFETARTNRKNLEECIERRLLEVLGYEVCTFVRTISEVQAAVTNDAFTHILVTPDVRLCLIFISKPLPDSVVFPVRSAKGDAELVAATSGEVFGVGYILDGKPGNITAFVEKTYKVRATTRFFTTTAKILAAELG